MEAINALAAELGCSPADLKCLAVGVAEAMKKDDAVDAFFKHPEMQVALCEAYVAAQLKKFDAFVVTYMKNKEAREAFQIRVLQLLGE